MSTVPSFEIPNPKHEIRNKSKTQKKNVRNEEARSHPWRSRWLVGAFLGVLNDDASPGHSRRSVVRVLVIWIFGFEFVSDFGFRASDLASARDRVTMNTPPFLFVVCQVGAERVLKQELSGEWPDFRFAFSRPGFVTFKLTETRAQLDDFDLRSVFARTYGFSLGRVEGRTAERAAASLWTLVGDRGFDHLHVWQRDTAMPGDKGFEPGITPLAVEVGRIVVDRRQAVSTERSLPVNLVARPGDSVLDCVLVEPNQWWIGFHRATALPTRWPGGTPKIDLPPDTVSRAYLKTREALLWSRLPVSRGDRCVEIGSSPGGSCQALLDRGLIVTGIDPADMDDLLLADPHFTHIKARGADLKRREFRRIKWLMADSNVAPKHTLDTVEHIVTNRQVNVRGMLLTLKLLDWKLAESIPDYIQRIRSWGYEYVRARQLAFNRQEICVAAMRRRQMRRESKRASHRRTK
jgi:23S rRNA (cytidine2498-2'-O)-methyltransferase